jgi:hypothetical protein
MPQSGERNKKLGFYRSVCCGKEIAVPADSDLPTCPIHPNEITIWNPITAGDTVQFSKTSNSSSATRRFEVGEQVIIVGPVPQKGSQGCVIAVVESALDQVHRYDVQLEDGTWIRCFGFELERVPTESARCA